MFSGLHFALNRDTLFIDAPWPDHLTWLPVPPSSHQWDSFQIDPGDDATDPLQVVRRQMAVEASTTSGVVMRINVKEGCRLGEIFTSMASTRTLSTH